MLFQSLFMSTTVQPLACAASSALIQTGLSVLGLKLDAAYLPQMVCCPVVSRRGSATSQSQSPFALEAAIACSTFSLRSPMLKLAPACIGGYSTKVGMYSAIIFPGIWKRHISCLNTSQ
jgi:hypothetical protein